MAPSAEDQQKVVSFLVNEGKKKYTDPKPNVIHEDPKQIEQLTNQIRKKIQERK